MAQALASMKVGDLRKMATGLGIKNSHGYRKAELVALIGQIAGEVATDAIETTPAERPTESASESKSETRVEAVAVKEEDAPREQMSEVLAEAIFERQFPVIEQSAMNRLVAYHNGDGTICSAKLINRSTNRRVVKLVRLNGKELVIEFRDVIWIKDIDAKWPAWVYQCLRAHKPVTREWIAERLAEEYGKTEG